MTAATEPSSSYLEQFLQRKVHAQQTDPSDAALDDNNGNGHDTDDARNRRAAPQAPHHPLVPGTSKHGVVNIDHHLGDQLFGDGNNDSGVAPVARRFGILPAPRSPPRRPGANTTQRLLARTSTQGWSRHDSYASLNPPIVIHPVETYPGQHGVGASKRCIDQRSIDRTVLDAKAENFQRHEVPATTTAREDVLSIPPLSGVEKMRPQQAWREQSEVAHNDNAALPCEKKQTARMMAVMTTTKGSNFPAGAAPSARHRPTTVDLGRRLEDSSDVIMSARESSALFWEESESIEAMSAIGYGCREERDRGIRSAIGNPDVARDGTNGGKLRSLATDYPRRGGAISGRGRQKSDYHRRVSTTQYRGGRIGGGPIASRRCISIDGFRSQGLGYTGLAEGADHGHNPDERQHIQHSRGVRTGATIKADAGPRRTDIQVRQHGRGPNPQCGLGTAYSNFTTAVDGASPFGASVVASSGKKWTAGCERDGGGSGCVRGTGRVARQSTLAAGVRKEKGASKARMLSVIPESSLGTALRTLGGLVTGDGSKVSAVGKHITTLEGVPAGVASRATHLYLSNNSLSSLQGLDSFSGVISMSIAHNLVRRVEDLRPLAALALVETVSLEGNAVCGAANYRAHVVSLLRSTCLRTLDRREVSPLEKIDASAIVAAERAATDRIARERCRCILLTHMSILLRCHSEFRETLLRTGGGQQTRAEESDGVTVCGGGRYSRMRQPGVLLSAGDRDAFGRRVWRQRSAMEMPIHQVRIVLRPEDWAAFDRSEVEGMERRGSDESAEIFAEIVAARRAKGQGTHDLSEGAIATLDSPGTRMWTHVLEEVQRRVHGTEADLLARCEGIRRQEAEMFRQASAQTARFLRDLAANVGSSDDEWAIVTMPPPPLPRPPPQHSARKINGRSIVRTGFKHSSRADDAPAPPDAANDGIAERCHADTTFCRGTPTGKSYDEAGKLAAVRWSNTGVVLSGGRDLVDAARGVEDGQSDSGLSRPSERNRPTGSDRTTGRGRRTEPSNTHRNTIASGNRPSNHPPVARLDFPPQPRNTREVETAASRVTMASAGMFLLARSKEHEARDFGAPPAASVSSPIRGNEVVGAAEVKLEPGREVENDPAPENCKAAENIAEGFALPERYMLGGDAEKVETRRTAGRGENGQGQEQEIATSGGERARHYYRRIDATTQGAGSECYPAAAGSANDNISGERPHGDHSAACHDAPNTGKLSVEEPSTFRPSHTTVHRGMEKAAVSPGGDGGDSPNDPPPIISFRPSEHHAAPLHPSMPSAQTSPDDVRDNCKHTTVMPRASPTTERTGWARSQRSMRPPSSPTSPSSFSSIPTATATSIRRDSPASEAHAQEQQSERARDNIDLGATGSGISTTMLDDEDDGAHHGWSGDRVENYGRNARETPSWWSSTETDVPGAEEATRRLLQEAARVKRLISNLEKADAAAAEGGIDGLGEDDPARFLASLRLVELKPLAPKLAEALERAAPSSEGLMLGGGSGGGDSSSASGVPEPRTTRALRDQVTALGMEVSRRAEGCAEARKLNVSLRRQVEIARRTRARNLDTVDVACRKLIAKAASEVQVLHESRRVAREAERYHATLAQLQERVDVTLSETRQVVSGSESIARRLRFEMEERAEEISRRGRDAEEGLADWEEAGNHDPNLRDRRRAYDCDLLVMRHRETSSVTITDKVDGNLDANLNRYDNGKITDPTAGTMSSRGRARLAAAWKTFRARIYRQRRARAWFAEAQLRRDAQIARTAFLAFALGSRSRAATAAATAARCRAGLAAWRRAAALSCAARIFRRQKLWMRGLRGLQQWRRYVVASALAQRGGQGSRPRLWGREREMAPWEEQEAGLPPRAKLFRERRAKRVVFKAWRNAIASGSMIEPAEVVEAGVARRRGGRRGIVGGWYDPKLVEYGADFDGSGSSFAVRRGQGARLRTAEALARRRRFETQARVALRWWRRHWQCRALARTACQRRALKLWRLRAREARAVREATAEARGRYLVVLGKRVLGAWSLATSTRARRRAAAGSLVSALFTILTRSACARWASQVATATQETEQTAVALEYCYDRSLRRHLRAWSSLVRERRILRRFAMLFMRGWKMAEAATAFRLWRRRVAQIRDAALRRRRIAAWAAATSRRRNRDDLSRHFSAWSSLLHRRDIVRSLFRRAAARKRHSSLAGAFRTLTLSAARRTYQPHTNGGTPVAASDASASGDCRSDVLNGEAAAEAVKKAVQEMAALEGKVRTLCARLAHERARALDRREEARRVAKEARRADRERARCTERLCRRRQRQGDVLDRQPEAVLLAVPSTRAAVVASGSAGGDPPNDKPGGFKAVEAHGRVRGKGVVKNDESTATVTFAVESCDDEDPAGWGLVSSLGLELSQLSEREGELFGKLQAETFEMHQRARAAEIAEGQARAEADKRAAATAAALASALAEGKRLKAEAEAREPHCAQLELEAEYALAQAAGLSERLAGAEQDLGFEIARNAELLHARDDGNTRLHTAVTAAEKRLAAAEDALQRKDRELENLRAQGAREGLRFGVSGMKNDLGSVSGGNCSRAVGTTAADLEYRVFAATAGAHTAAQRCSAAAAARRTAAGLALKEALHAVKEEEVVAEAAETWAVVCEGSSGDGGDNNPILEAQRLVRESAAEGMRAVSELALRRVEAKLRHSADLSVRASLQHRPQDDPRSLVQTLAQRFAGDIGGTSVATDDGDCASVSNASSDGDGSDGAARRESESGSLGRKRFHRHSTAQIEFDKQCSKPCTEDEEANEITPSHTATAAARGGSSAVDAANIKSRGGAGRDKGKTRDSETREEQVDKYNKTPKADEPLSPRQPPEDGLTELRHEIADLEAKILGRLGGVNSGDFVATVPAEGRVGGGRVVDDDNVEREYDRGDERGEQPSRAHVHDPGAEQGSAMAIGNSSSAVVGVAPGKITSKKKRSNSPARAASAAASTSRCFSRSPRSVAGHSTSCRTGPLSCGDGMTCSGNSEKCARKSAVRGNARVASAKRTAIRVLSKKTAATGNSVNDGGNRLRRTALTSTRPSSGTGTRMYRKEEVRRHASSASSSAVPPSPSTRRHRVLALTPPGPKPRRDTANGNAGGSMGSGGDMYGRGSGVARKERGREHIKGEKKSSTVFSSSDADGSHGHQGDERSDSGGARESDRNETKPLRKKTSPLMTTATDTAATAGRVTPAAQGPPGEAGGSVLNLSPTASSAAACSSSPGAWRKSLLGMAAKHAAASTKRLLLTGSSDLSGRDPVLGEQNGAWGLSSVSDYCRSAGGRIGEAGAVAGRRYRDSRGGDVGWSIGSSGGASGGFGGSSED